MKWTESPHVISQIYWCILQPQSCVNKHCCLNLTWHSPLTHPLLPSRSLFPQRWRPCQLVVVFTFPWSWSLQLPVSLAALRLRKAMALSTLTDRVDDGDCSFILVTCFFNQSWWNVLLVLQLVFSVTYDRCRDAEMFDTSVSKYRFTFLNSGCKYFHLSKTSVLCSRCAG